MSRAGPSGSRVPSPTYTTFSGISNYRQSSGASSFRKNGGAGAPPVPAVDGRLVARNHFEELSRYLAEYLAREAPNARSTARQKLTRLTRQQFQELSTDVYDELLRRRADSEKPNSVPFLPVRDDFHPKRNQARQKLATLPVSRFQDLSSDVYYELSRRYPEFKEDGPPPEMEPRSPDSNYGDLPSPMFDPDQAVAPLVPRPGSGRTPDAPPPSDRRKPSDGNISIARRKLSEDIASESRSTRSRQSEDPYGGVDDTMSYGSPPRAPGIGGLSGGRRRPSEDIPMRQDRRKPSRDISSPPNAYRSPNSRGRPSIDEDAGRRSRSRDTEFRDEPAGPAATAMRDEIVPTKSTITEEEVTLPPFARRDSDIGEMEDLRSPDRRRTDDAESVYDDDDDAFSPRTPQAASALGGLGALSRRDDYDATSPRDGPSQGRAQELERQLDVAEASRVAAVEQATEQVLALETELAALRQRDEEHNEDMAILRRELDELRTAKELAERDLNEEREEVDALKARCNALEMERQTHGDMGAAGGGDPTAMATLQADMQGLIVELTELSARNDELMMAKEEDMVRVQRLEARVEEYKRMYERAKTELRSLKVTSQLFAQSAPRLSDTDRLPVSVDGVIADVYVTAFLSGIDDLLNAGRSAAPTAVLAPTKTVVNALHAITDDIRTSSNATASSDDVQAMLARAEATIENLVSVAKTHATSAGMSPVSLLDAAASHVSAVITELSKTVLIRRAKPGEGTNLIPDGKDTNLDTISESPIRKTVRYASDRDSSNGSSSPPPIFDRAAAPASDATTTVDGEDAWVELKPYLEAQTEAVVFAIQSVLSGVRSASTPASALSENITRVITIVSSIVAVCKDSFPAVSVPRGEQLLADLSEQANRLSEALERGGELAKEDRQIVARSSFAVANAMKELVKL